MRVREILQKVLVDQSVRKQQQLGAVAVATAQEFIPWASE